MCGSRWSRLWAGTGAEETLQGGWPEVVKTAAIGVLRNTFCNDDINNHRLTRWKPYQPRLSRLVIKLVFAEKILCLIWKITNVLMNVLILRLLISSCAIQSPVQLKLVSCFLLLCLPVTHIVGWLPLCPSGCLWWKHYSWLNLVCTHWWSYFHTISKYNHTCISFLGIFFSTENMNPPLCPSHLILINYVLYYCDLSIFTRVSTYTSFIIT